MKRLLCVLVILAAALVAAGVAGADQSYTDPSGDAPAGTADIVGTSIGNDPTGMISIKVTTAAPLGPTDAVFLYVDADKNAGTGAGSSGRDYLWIGTPVVGVLTAWDGSTFVPQPGKGTVVPSGNVLTFSINRADLGNTSGFDFFAASFNLVGEGTPGDEAPDVGAYIYDLVFPQCSNGKDDDGDGKIDGQDRGCSSTTDDNESDDPVHVKLGVAKTTPLHPKAGGRAIVSAAATRVETKQALDSGTVACSGRVAGGAALRGAGTLVSGRAQCAFKIPKTAKGKTVRGKITLNYQSAPPATTPFAFKTAE